MKINKPLMLIMTRKYTNRINLVLAIGFMLALTSAYGDYVAKKIKDPTIPWYAMFFRVNAQPSWLYATPFNK
jgi:hypothetical protein